MNFPNVIAMLFRQTGLPLTIVFTIGLVSCSGVEKSTGIDSKDVSSKNVYTAATLDEYKALYSLESYLTDADATEVIEVDCAILVYPTDHQIGDMRRTIGEENFYAVADDNNWYQATAISLIDSAGVNTVTAKGQYLELRGDNETWTLDIRKDKLPAWNLIFFKRSKEPKVVPTAGLTFDQIATYFEQGK